MQAGDDVSRPFVHGWLLTVSLSFACGCAEDTPATSAVRETVVAGEAVAAGETAAAGEGAAGERLDDLSEEESPAKTPTKATPAEPREASLDSAPRSLPAQRLSDDRPPLNEPLLQANGIHVLRSRRLVLLTDLDPEAVQNLPPLADQLFETLEAALGKLPSAIDSSEFQVTGCIMAARERFEACQLLPTAELTIKHGRHFNYRFWMFNPESDYYRRHLMLHEFVHCFMTCVGGMNDIPPLWYTEGIAEYFSTHHVVEGDLPAQFGVMPSDVKLFPGWGRISEIRRSFVGRPSAEVVPGGFISLDAVFYPESTLFDQDSQYAHAWAVVWYLFNNPRWAGMRDQLKPLRRRLEFEQAIGGLSKREEEKLAIEWLLFLDSVCEGFDTDRAFPDWGAAARIAEDSPLDSPTGQSSAGQSLAGPFELSVEAAKSWQCIPLAIPQGTVLRLTASGQAILGEQPRPWLSEPEGITFDYHRGRPLGQLVAMFVAKNGAWASRRIPVGRDTTIEIPSDGTLWLQANESSAHRRDNTGSYTVKVEVLKP